MITKTRNIYHVSLDDAKMQLKIDSDETFDDDLINQLIQAALEIAENYIEKSIAETDVTFTIYDFAGDVINIPEGNYISLTKIEDSDSNEYTQDHIRIYDDHFEIELDEYIDVDVLTVTFKAGYASGSCPEPIKRAILIKVDDLYNTERGSYTLSLQNNRTFERYLNFYKPYRMNYFRQT